MVLLRGLFGARLSWLPTVLNVVQLLGWTTFELVTISTAMHQITAGVPRWVYVVAGGVITTVLALRPLGWIRVLRRYVTVLVVDRAGLPRRAAAAQPVAARSGTARGTASGSRSTPSSASRCRASPIAADYSRHSTSVRNGVLGTFVGYSVTQIVCYGIGLVALLTVATAATRTQIFSAFMAIPIGTLAFAVLAIRELDQSFVDTYSTAISVQNIRPRWDRRVLALADRHAGDGLRARPRPSATTRTS